METPQYLSPEDLHRIAMNYVGKELQENGFEFLAVNSTLKKDPQFVCLHPEGGKVFVLVRATTHSPLQPTWSEIATWNKIKLKASEYQAEIWSSTVLIENNNAFNGESPVYEDVEYNLHFSGF